MSTRKKILILIAVFGLGLVVSGCLKKPIINQNQTNSVATSTTEIDTSDWKTYRNEEFGIEFDYPDDFEIAEERQEFWFTIRLLDANNFSRFTVSNLPTGFEDAEPFGTITIDDIIFQRSIREAGELTTYYFLNRGETDKYFIYNFRNGDQLRLVDSILSTVKIL